MSTQQGTLTYEGILELFRQTREEFQQVKEIVQRTAEQIEATNKAVKEMQQSGREMQQAVKETQRTVGATNTKIGALDLRVGKMVENLVGEGNLVAQFRELGYKVKRHSRHMIFGEEGTSESGEIDLFMEDGDVAVLVEVKTTLKMDHVVEHLERLEKYRRFADADADGKNGKRFIGAVAGTVIAENVINFAHENGLYVIIQSARAVEILAQPEGFKAKEW